MSDAAARERTVSGLTGPTRSVKRLLPAARLIEYEGAPHGLTDTHKERLNQDMVAFVTS